MQTALSSGARQTRLLLLLSTSMPPPLLLPLLLLAIVFLLPPLGMLILQQGMWRGETPLQQAPSHHSCRWPGRLQTRQC